MSEYINVQIKYKNNLYNKNHGRKRKILPGKDAP